MKIKGTVLYSVPVEIDIPTERYGNMENADIAEALYAEADRKMAAEGHKDSYIAGCSDDEINSLPPPDEFGE